MARFARKRWDFFAVIFKQCTKCKCTSFSIFEIDSTKSSAIYRVDAKEAKVLLSFYVANLLCFLLLTLEIDFQAGESRQCAENCQPKNHHLTNQGRTTPGLPDLPRLTRHFQFPF